MDKMLGWLDGKAQAGAGAGSRDPFYLYYAPNAIHQ